MHTRCRSTRQVMFNNKQSRMEKHRKEHMQFTFLLLIISKVTFLIKSKLKGYTLLQ